MESVPRFGGRWHFYEWMVRAVAWIERCGGVVVSPAVAIKDEIAAEATAMAMGWVERENGTTIWVRSKDIGVDEAPYCDTAIEVVRSYTH